MEFKGAVRSARVKVRKVNSLGKNCSESAGLSPEAPARRGGQKCELITGRISTGHPQQLEVGCLLCIRWFYHLLSAIEHFIYQTVT